VIKGLFPLGFSSGNVVWNFSLFMDSLTIIQQILSH
jgi:hypothetical protein